MSCFVRSFYVNINKIPVLESLKGGLTLPFVVGIKITGCSRDINDIKAGKNTDTFDQVNSRDNRTGEVEFLL